MARHTIPNLIEQTDERPIVRRPLLLSLVLSLRPAQWTKNLIIFGALMLGERLLDLRSVVLAAAAFAIFCALSGVVYLINDIADRDADRQHPIKMRRPIASGDLPVKVALLTAGVLAGTALVGAFLVNIPFGILAFSYLALLTLYSGPLKHVVISDVLTIAVGFVIRAAAGAVAISVEIGPWLYILTILLALFLALTKRRHELVLLADRATGHRRILQEYSPYLLDQMISVVTASTIVAYAFYTVSPETIAKFQTDMLAITLPFPLYGIFRYLYLVHQKEGGGSPAEMLITDKPLLTCVALWASAVAIIIYGPHAILLWGK